MLCARSAAARGHALANRALSSRFAAPRPSLRARAAAATMSAEKATTGTTTVAEVRARTRV